jgi:hypothetical protein
METIKKKKRRIKSVEVDLLVSGEEFLLVKDLYRQDYSLPIYKKIDTIYSDPAVKAPRYLPGAKIIAVSHDGYPAWISGGEKVIRLR